jgi:hypothetical protein
MNKSLVLDRAINLAQLFALVGGIVWIGREIGQKETALVQVSSDTAELSSIVKDLVRSQILSTAKGDELTRWLDALTKRVERLEASR